MSNDMRQQLVEAIAEMQAGASALARATATLEAVLQAHVQEGMNTLPSSFVPATAHRREHRCGRAPKIPYDAELQAFIAARIDRLTFAEIAREVAEHFPPARRVSKTAIHEWWKKEGCPGRD